MPDRDAQGRFTSAQFHVHTDEWERQLAGLRTFIARIHDSVEYVWQSDAINQWESEGGLSLREEDDMTDDIERPECAVCSTDDDTVTERDSGDMRCDDCVIRCENCEAEMEEEREDLYGGMGILCEDCIPTCDCGNTAYTTEIYTVNSGDYLCEHCYASCEECGHVGHVDDFTYRDYFGHYCENCAHWCDSCDESYYSDYCENCADSDDEEGIREYGSTHPSTWYGGPGGRYYIGIEHEVYMDLPRSATHMHEWSAANVGTDFLDCKHDGSVIGYEIATQPMTPEFFENVDWDGYMQVLNDNQPVSGGVEPTDHGLHVHIGKVAFDRDEVAIAAFCYLIAQGTHLERIARREPYHYCNKVTQPVKVAISRGKQTAQYRRIMNTGNPVYAGRDAINLTNSKTIEIRAFASTRSANDLRNAVRVVYYAADYVNELRKSKRGLNRQVLAWAEFARWVAANHPEGFASIAGLETENEPSNKRRASHRTW